MQIRWPKEISYDDRPLVGWIDLANGTMFRIIIFFTGRYPDPRDGLFVGLERVGCFLFDVNIAKSWDYVSQKLFLSESDARPMADFINAQLGLVFETQPQQGEYSADYIMGVEPYGLFGENHTMPLKPEILNE